MGRLAKPGAVPDGATLIGPTVAPYWFLQSDSEAISQHSYGGKWEAKMKYHQYYAVDIVNGPGTRCTLFVSGCMHECPGCYNKSTWRLNSGLPFTQEMEDRIIADLNDTRIKRQGISLSGGDPLHPQNVPDILKLVKRIHAECPGKDIWVWTGYKIEELNAAQQEVVDLINVLIDGKFMQDLKDPMLIWRGSSNQVVHHLR